MIVYVSDLFTHILDLGIAHEPCCHFVVPSQPTKNAFSKLVPVPGVTSEILDLTTFDVFKISVSKDLLLRSYFDEETSLQNKLSILHYVLNHLNDMETIRKVLKLYLLYSGLV